MPLELELELKQNFPSGGFFYVSSVLIKQKILNVGDRYKITIDEVR